MNSRYPPIVPAADVADIWEAYSGDTAWVRYMRRFGELDGKARLWCGRPRSSSAIPLTFQLFAPDGAELPSYSRLRDIKAAVGALEARP